MSAVTKSSHVLSFHLFRICLGFHRMFLSSNFVSHSCLWSLPFPLLISPHLYLIPPTSLHFTSSSPSPSLSPSPPSIITTTIAQGRRLTELSLWARDALATNEERLARAERILVLAEQVFESDACAVCVFVGFLCFAKVSRVCVSTGDNTWDCHFRSRWLCDW